MSDTPQTSTFDVESEEEREETAQEFDGVAAASKGIGSKVTLPCGYLPEPGGPIYREVRIREMQGFDEDELSNPANARGSKAFDVLLSRCLLSVEGVYEKPDPHKADRRMEEIARQLRLGDRYYLLLALRRLSLGDEYTVTMVCPSCRKQSTFDLDLSDLKRIDMPNPESESTEVTLPSGRKVTVRPLMAKDESALAKLRDQHKHDFATASLRLRVTHLDGQLLVSNVALQHLSLRDRDALRSEMFALDGGIDTEAQFECPRCMASFSGDVPLDQPSFFFPSGTRRR